MSAAGIEELDFSEENLAKVKRMIEIPKSIAEEYEFIEGRWAKVRP